MFDLPARSVFTMGVILVSLSGATAIQRSLEKKKNDLNHHELRQRIKSW